MQRDQHVEVGRLSVLGETAQNISGQHGECYLDEEYTRRGKRDIVPTIAAAAGMGSLWSY